MKRFFILLILCLFLLQSCTVIRIISIYIKEGRNKSEDEVNDYLKAKKFTFYDYSFMLPVNSIYLLDSINHVLDLYKYNNQIGQSAIQLRVYDSLGCFVNGYAQCYGSINKLNILSEEETKYFEYLPNNYSLIFENELDLLDIDNEIKEDILLKSSQRKFTFVVYWSIWTGYYSRIVLVKLKKYLKKYEMQENSLIIFINQDNLPEKESEENNIDNN